MDTNWQFDDPPNAASLTTTFVLEGASVLRVYHDYDGGWQFHGSPDQAATTEVARLVSLKNMIDRDSTLAGLSDLPYGWRAFRESVDRPWMRQKNSPFPTYAENGYYLEDAVWVAQYRGDVNPPSEEIRNGLIRNGLYVGMYVKLLFRFQAEDAERQDNETERMWVLITALDVKCFTHSGTVSRLVKG